MSTIHKMTQLALLIGVGAAEESFSERVGSSNVTNSTDFDNSASVLLAATGESCEIFSDCAGDKICFFLNGKDIPSFNEYHNTDPHAPKVCQDPRSAGWACNRNSDCNSGLQCWPDAAHNMCISNIKCKWLHFGVNDCSVPTYNGQKPICTGDGHCAVSKSEPAAPGLNPECPAGYTEALSWSCTKA